MRPPFFILNETICIQLETNVIIWILDVRC